ncbi:MAG: cation transporter [Anaerolineaceae bacterium]|nr:cation transporter [Anaerolineaceae bacterium]
MKDKSKERNRIIIRYNIAGIVMNFLLCTAKLAVGHMIHSRAVFLDGLNGFSDMISSLISMFSTLFAEKRTDKEHPFGYGRMEYITSMFTTVFIIYMGLYAIYGAVRELMSGEVNAPDYNTAVIILMCVSALAKITYGLLSRKTGKKINSTALIMTGTESLGDSIVAAGILLTIVIYRTTKIDVEPWLSIVISLFLIKTGIDVMRECINKLLGTRADPLLYKSLKEKIMEEPQVLNAFNLVIHNYGEEIAIASVDIEVEESLTAVETTKLMRRIIAKAIEMDVKLSSVGVYGSDIREPANAEMWDKILDVVRKNPDFIRAYAFSYDPAERSAFFIALPEPTVKDKKKAVGALALELEGIFPETEFNIECAIDI